MKNKILIVDDHPMTVDSYVNLLSESIFTNLNSQFLKCYNAQTAYEKINLTVQRSEKIDLALLDISIPPYKNILNGIELAKLIRKKYIHCKIILLTMHSEPVKVNNIMKEITPEGFISKSDIDFESFPLICKKIIEGQIFYSKNIMASQRKMLEKNINWDKHNDKILLLISEGVKTINLPDYIPLSMSSIEKRKASMKDQLLMGRGSDRELIGKAKILGIL